MDLVSPTRITARRRRGKNALSAESSHESDVGLGCVTESDRGEEEPLDVMCTINDGLPSREPQVHTADSTADPASGGGSAAALAGGAAAAAAAASAPVVETTRVIAPTKRRRSARLAAVAAAAASARAKAEREAAQQPLASTRRAAAAGEEVAAAAVPGEAAPADPVELASDVGMLVPPPIEEESSAYLDAEDLDDYVTESTSDESAPTVKASEVSPASGPAAVASPMDDTTSFSGALGLDNDVAESRLGRGRQLSTTGSSSGKISRRRECSDSGAAPPQPAMMQSQELIAYLDGDTGLGRAAGPEAKPQAVAPLRRAALRRSRPAAAAASMTGIHDSVELVEFLESELRPSAVELTPAGMSAPPEFGWQTRVGALPDIGEDSAEENAVTPPTSGAAGATPAEEPGAEPQVLEPPGPEDPACAAYSRRESDRFEGFSIATFATVESSFSDVMEAPVEAAAASAPLAAAAPPPPPQRRPASAGLRPAAVAPRAREVTPEFVGDSPTAFEAYTARSTFPDPEPTPIDRPVPEPEHAAPLAAPESWDDSSGLRTSRKRVEREPAAPEPWRSASGLRVVTPLAVPETLGKDDAESAETPAAKTPKTAHKGVVCLLLRFHTVLQVHVCAAVWVCPVQCQESSSVQELDCAAVSHCRTVVLHLTACPYHVWKASWHAAALPA